MYKKSFKFSPGSTVKEKVTGFSGVITGVAFYLTGCNSYLVTSRSSNSNEEAKAVWYDEGRLSLIQENTISFSDVQTEENGADILPNIGTKGA